MIATCPVDFTREAFHILNVSLQLLKIGVIAPAHTLSRCLLTEYSHSVVQGNDNDIPIAGQHTSVHEISSPFHVGSSVHKHHNGLWIVPRLSESCNTTSLLLIILFVCPGFVLQTDCSALRRVFTVIRN